MDEFDEAVDVFGGDLVGDSWVSWDRILVCLMGFGTYGFVLLVVVIHVLVENLDKELNGHGGIHASVCHTESALQAFEDAFAVSV